MSEKPSEDLEIESIGLSSQSRTKSKSKEQVKNFNTQSLKIPQGVSRQEELSSFSKTTSCTLPQLPFCVLILLIVNKPTSYSQMGSQNVTTQPQKIVISKDQAQKAKEERERQQEEVKSKKPAIYYKAQAELRYTYPA
jgi:hypothetical protein